MSAVSYSKQSMQHEIELIWHRLYAAESSIGATLRLDWKNSVRLATTAALPAYVAVAVPGGTATLTALAPGLLTVDGTAPTPGQSIAVKNETGANQVYNGLYTVDVNGAGVTYVLTRRGDVDDNLKFTANLAFEVSEGATQADTGWSVATNDPINLNVTPIVFQQMFGFREYAATIAALGAINDAPMSDGHPVYVGSVEDVWVLRKSSTLAVDGITVIAALSGGTSQWIRLKLPNQRWIAQTTWYVNSTIGTDEGDGSANDAAHALRTLDELGRRWGDQVITSVITVYLPVGTALDDNGMLKIRRGPSGAVFFRGTPLTVYTSPLPGITAKTDLAPPVPQMIEDGAPLDWTPHLKRRVRLTTGANIQAWAFVAKNLGAGQARTSPFSKPVVGYGNSMTPATVLPAVGDQFVIETLPLISHMLLVAECTDNHSVSAGNPGVIFDSLDFPTTAGTSVTVDASLDYVGFVGCTNVCGRRSAGPLVATSSHLRDSTLGTYSQTGAFEVYVCLITGEFASQTPGWSVVVDGNTLVQGTRLRVRAGRWLVGLCGVFDSATVGVLVETSGFLRSVTFAYGSHLLWGSGNATYGLQVKSGSGFEYVTTKPTVTGATNDAIVGGTAKAWIAIPYVEAANGAMIVVDQ